MKKMLLYLWCFLSLGGCMAPSTVIHKDLVSGIQPLTYDELQTKIAEDRYFILYLGRSDCRDCLAFYPQLESYLNDHPDLGVYYLDVRAFREAARKEGATQEEKDFFQNMTETLAFDWVPTIQARQGKKVLSSITYLDEAYYQIEDAAAQEAYEKASVEKIWEWLEEVGRK